ncbi:MAG: dTDP-glucose 4,6-dehydratase [Candidatus Methanophagaceae archaeon]|nr:MAG: dTDP-glucose 4,6-dehydratase [Methanophagales archaeon]
MKRSSSVIIFGIGILVAVFISGCVDQGNHEQLPPSENGTGNGTGNPKLALASSYEPREFSVTAKAPQYQLPLNLNEVANSGKINATFNLESDAKAKLESNGFVVIPWRHGDDIVQPYKTMKELGIPIFVTSDTLLHLYHIQFNEILKDLEEGEFFDEILDLSKAMQERSQADYEAFSDATDSERDSELKEAARRNVAYFSVALTLLQTPTEAEEAEAEEVEVPDYVKDEVAAEVGKIEKHEGFEPSCIFNADACEGRGCEDECCYCEDYSQYVPRGHYTRSERLEQYFKAMMWYGRTAFLLKGGNVSAGECSGVGGGGGRETPLVTEEDAKIATIQASLLSSELPAVKVGENKTKTAQEVWTRIYSVTAFFVGTADDLTPYEYQRAVREVFGAEHSDQTFLKFDDEKLLQLKAELAGVRSPEIYGGSGVCVVYPPFTREKLQACLAKTKGLRFMGQRFVPDSYLFQQLVSPAVGMFAGEGEECESAFTCCYTAAGPARCFPRGLDVFAVLGSERAEEILKAEGDTKYEGKNTSYEKQLNSLKQEFEQFSVSDWNRNLYWSWLYALKPLLAEFPAGYPTFMQTQEWQEKELQTALASWTELRHDTILYAKQSYTPVLKSAFPQPTPVRGFVEPVPEFYARLLALTEMTESGLAKMDALEVLEEKHRDRLESLESILNRLIEISTKELENRELSEEDYEFIRRFGENLDSVVAGVETEGKQTTIVADVHTDANTKQVLEEGVGEVDLILVAYKPPGRTGGAGEAGEAGEGQIVVGAGPVLSYYEFKHPMSDRLTDEKWRKMLKAEVVGGVVPKQPNKKEYERQSGKEGLFPYTSTRFPL